MAIGILLLVLIYFAAVIPIGAVFLRGGIALANRIIGPVHTHGDAATGEPVKGAQESAVDNAPVRDLANPFSPPATVSQHNFGMEASSSAIPKLDFGRACLVMLILVVAMFVISVLFGLALRMTGMFGMVDLAFVNVAVWGLMFFAGSAVLMVMAPTTYSRSMLAVLMTYLMALAVAACLGGVVFLISSLSR
ncbi:hypothetical protein [Planctomycetes bacterium K23_9]|uniref:hypothetical protein n=1 Tax=Stieleria marina TaxID=1930275 RepID=UPI0011A4C33D